MTTAPETAPETDEAQGLHGRLHSRLLAGDIRPGTLLIPSSLSNEYGVSRTPVREALRRLEHEGLVVQATRGFTVRRRSPDEVLEVCEARIALEGSLAREAALKRSPLDLARMHHLHQLVTQIVSTPDHPDAPRAARLAHVDWHHAVRQAGHNRTTFQLLGLLDAQLFLSDWDTVGDEFPAAAGDLEVTLDEHARVMAAIEAGDPEAAKDLMEAHLKRGRDSRLERLAQRGD
jgi:DNA-binding GntR family transcriptional regulator